VEIKTEADSNDMMEDPCDDRPSDGMFGFLILYFLIYLSCLHCSFAAVLYDCCSVTCNTKASYLN